MKKRSKKHCYWIGKDLESDEKYFPCCLDGKHYYSFLPNYCPNCGRLVTVHNEEAKYE